MTGWDFAKGALVGMAGVAGSAFGPLGSIAGGLLARGALNGLDAQMSGEGEGSSDGDSGHGHDGDYSDWS